MKFETIRCIIMGPPGSGKGTISARIVKHFNIKHLAIGDILRSNMERNTAMGQKIKDFIEDGQLVPDKIMNPLINDELRKLSRENCLLDGYPRTVEQARYLSDITQIKVVMNLAVPASVIVERVGKRWIHPASGRIYNLDFSPPKIMGKDDVTGEPLIRRPDDYSEAVRTRLAVYANTVDPLLNFYKELGLLGNFHGKTSDEIWPKVLNYLGTISELILTNK